MISFEKESIWFERKFDNRSENNLIPNIVERLIGTPIRVMQKLKRVPERELEIAHAGKWTIKEEIGHLVDLEAVHLHVVEHAPLRAHADGSGG